MPPDLPMHYVDNVNVVHTPTEFTISFMQSQPPLLTSNEQMEAIESIPTRVVARLIVNPMKMQLVVTTLMENFQAYVETYLKQEAEDGKDKIGSDTNATG